METSTLLLIFGIFFGATMFIAAVLVLAWFALQKYLIVIFGRELMKSFGRIMRSMIITENDAQKGEWIVKKEEEEK